MAYADRSASRHDAFVDPQHKEITMPQGDKSAYTDKQKRKAEHIEEGYEDRGVGKEEAERRAWATVNKESGGGEKSGSGRGKPENHASSRKGGPWCRREPRLARTRSPPRSRMLRPRTGQRSPISSRMSIDGSRTSRERWRGRWER